MADLGISAEDLQKLAELVEQFHLSELRYEEGEVRVTLRTADFVRSSAPPPAFFAAPPASSAVPALPDEYGFFPADNDQIAPVSDDADDDAAQQTRIEAPVMGVFYRSPAPGEAAYVEVGDMIEAGQVVGMIEAMKVFSEVPSEVSGKIVAVPGKNGGLVQPGDALVIVEVV